MNYDEIAHLRSQHPAWVLLRSNNVALVLSFLGRIFVDGNASGIPASELAGQLDDELFAFNQRLGEDAFPRSATAYLDDWASPEHGWLRKYYPSGADEAHFDLAPAVEKALLWVQDLPAREFIGTESRLNTIFELLRQMVFGADDDPQRRLSELQRRRAQIDEEIARAQRGELTMLDAVSQRDRYQQFARTARELLADFREVEENFRGLDRSLREQIAGWSGSKGALLDEALGSRASITESDQGRSFQAFYDFLLSHHKQAELTELLERLQQIEDLGGQDGRLRRIHFDWIDASERTQATVRLLSDQLRRFLDDHVWLENRRVFDLLHSIEGKALRVRNQPEPVVAMELDDTGVTVGLPMERPLFRRSRRNQLEIESMEHGDDDFDASAMLRASADRRARMDTGDASRRRFGFVTRVNVRITETTFPLVRAYPRGLLVSCMSIGTCSSSGCSARSEETTRSDSVRCLRVSRWSRAWLSWSGTCRCRSPASPSYSTRNAAIRFSGALGKSSERPTCPQSRSVGTVRSRRDGLADRRAE